MPGKVEKACEELLVALYDRSVLLDPNFKDTPKRMAKAYAELLSGENGLAIKSREILAAVDFPTNYHGIILSPKHITFSMCPHHLLPVEYEITIAYMPNKTETSTTVAGASKLARIADLLAHRAVLQETLTHDIVLTMNTLLRPKGVCVIIKGVHMCMRCRGVKTRAPFITDIMDGVFVDNALMRNELMVLLQMY